QVLQEVLICDGEEYVHLTPDEQKSRSAWFIDMKYVAAVEKKRWGDQRRWAYHVVGLNSDINVINRLHASRTPSHPTIDLSTTDPASPAHTSPKREASSSASKKTPSTKAKRTKQPVPPPSDTSSSAADDAESDDDFIADSDDGNDDSHDEYVISDDDDSEES
ncbi:unnamed protein product, partial [Pylaiella littoralis]